MNQPDPAFHGKSDDQLRDLIAYGRGAERELRRRVLAELDADLPDVEMIDPNESPPDDDETAS